MMTRVAFGADRVAADPALLGPVRRVGLATSDAARTATDTDRSSRSALIAAGVPIVRLFSPEHGIRVDAPDGAAVRDGHDAETGLPVVSLYGDRFAPTPESLADLDAMLVDLPDLGVRFYTYAWTLTHIIDACADANLPVRVMDRPNPLGGALTTVEGPILDPIWASFIGRHTVPVRHGLTLGELAMLWQRERRPGADVRVITCTGWERDQLWPETGLPFVPTSPAIATFDAALLYAGLCLFEATNLSVARGSSLSFQAAGAPWLDTDAVLDRLAARSLPGIMPHHDRFTPGTPPHAGNPCEAIRFDVVQPPLVRPVAAALALLCDIAATHPNHFAWAPYPTAANPSGKHHLERLLGTGLPVATIGRAAGRVTDAMIRDWVAAPGWEPRWDAVRLV
jgi:uncharacterized protein YbbC (DUF1343 family)